MKRILLALLLCFSPAIAQIVQFSGTPIPGSGTPTFVQAVGSTINDNNGLSGNAYQFNMPNKTLSGNVLVLGIAYPYSATRTVSISDSAGDTWPAATQITGTATTGNMRTAIYVLPNASAELHTLTITFDTSLKPFQYTLSEFYNVATSSAADGSIGAASVAGSSANAGSFTPSTNNDASGGHLIVSYAISNDTVGANNAHQASAMTPTNSASLLAADNIGTIPSVSAYSVQATNGAINPGFSITQSSGTNFVVAAVALKATSTGTAPTGIRVVRLLHATAQTQSNVTFLFPTNGNLRVVTLAAGSDLIGAATVTDNAGNTYNSRSTASQPQIFDNDGLTRTPSNSLTVTVATSSGMASVHFWDIAGANASSSFMNTSGIYKSAPGSGSVLPDLPDHTPNANVAGLTIAQTGQGTAGPQFGLASGAPAGAIFDDVYYSGMSDLDLMDNADPFGHANFSSNAAQTWNWNWNSACSGCAGSTAFATAASYK